MVKTIVRGFGPSRMPAPTKARYGGIAAGTGIFTTDGVIPAEWVQPGDKVITRDAGAQPVVSITQRVLTRVPLRIHAGALGGSVPGKDVLVAPHQLLLYRREDALERFGRRQILVPALQLLDGQTVRRAGDVTRFRVCELIFETSHIIYAEGLELSSAALHAYDTQVRAA